MPIVSAEWRYRVERSVEVPKTLIYFQVDRRRQFPPKLFWYMLHGLNSIPKPVFRTQTHTKERTKKVPKMYFFSAKLRLNCRRQICLCGHRTEEEDVCREGRGLLLLLSLLRRLKRRRRSVRYIEFPSSFFCGETPFDVHTDEGREGTHVGKPGEKTVPLELFFSDHSCAQFLPIISGKTGKNRCSKTESATIVSLKKVIFTVHRQWTAFRHDIKLVWFWF